jgi:hypothetical protein
VRAKTREAADDGAIFGEKPIAVQFGKISESGVKIVEGKRTFGMAGDLDAVPGAEI